MALSVTDLTEIAYRSFTRTSGCYKSINSGGKWFTVGWQNDVSGIFVEMDQTTYDVQKRIFYRDGDNGRTFCMTIETSTANMYIGCKTTEWGGSTLYAIFVVRPCVNLFTALGRIKIYADDPESLLDEVRFPRRP